MNIIEKIVKIVAGLSGLGDRRFKSERREKKHKYTKPERRCRYRRK